MVEAQLNNQPADNLLGREIRDAGTGEPWRITDKVKAKPGSTGGKFSVGYLVSHPVKGEAFLKAIDYSKAFKTNDSAMTLNFLTKSFLHEVAVLEKCRNERLSKVVIALEVGELDDPSWTINVPFVIFEKADGDIRNHLSIPRAFDTAWALRTLHAVSVGLQQIHSHQITHQDLKPSNVLLFQDDESKIADFGRASYEGHSAPYEDAEVAGDLQYAPPELLFGQVDPDVGVRRRACDLYHLGSLILFLFADANTTPALFRYLHPAQAPPTRYKDALPFVRDAFAEVVDELEAALDGDGKDDLVEAFCELCDPDPFQRGHPKARVGRGNRYDLRRYVSKFNLLANRAERGMLRSLKR